MEKSCVSKMLDSNSRPAKNGEKVRPRLIMPISSLSDPSVSVESAIKKRILKSTQNG